MSKEGKKSLFKRWWFWVVAFIVVIGVLANLGDGTNNQTSEQTSGQVKASHDTAKVTKIDATTDNKSDTKKEKPEKTEPQKPSVPTWGTGMYQVGKDIKPGIYFNPNAGEYVARLKGLSGEFDDIIANANPSGQWYLEIKSTDKAVNLTGDGWVKFDKAKSKHKIKTSFSDGVYLVGVDIKPGTYKLKGSSVYWARLKGVSMDFNAIIANGNPEGPTLVQVKPSDFAFEVNGGGTWTLQQ